MKKLGISNNINNKGFSLVEALVAAAIATGALYMVVSGTQQIQNITQRVESVLDEVLIVSQVTSKIKLILTESAYSASTNGSLMLTTNGIKTQGLCALVRIKDNKRIDAGAGNADIVVAFDEAKMNPNLWTPRWSAYVGDEFNFITNTKCPVPAIPAFSKCLSPKNPEAYGKKIKNIIIAANIIPLSIDPNIAGSGTFEPIALYLNRQFDSKKLAFMISTKVYYQQTDQAGKTSDLSSVTEEVVGASEVGVCTAQILNTAGIAKSYDLFLNGTGVPVDISKSLFNSTDFFTDLGKNPVTEIYFKSNQPVAGKVDATGFISTDLVKNIQMACTETRYRCKNKNTDRVFNKNIDASLGIQISSQSDLAFNPTFVISGNNSSLNLIKNQDQIVIDNGINNYQYESVGGQSKAFVYTANSNSAPVPLFLKNSGSSSLDLVITDRFTSTDDSIGPICSAVCKSPSGYFPEVKYSMPISTDKGVESMPFNYRSTVPVQCVVCYMKNCARLGVGTFGPLEYSDLIQPDEPLDSGLPECSIGDTDSIKDAFNLSQNISSSGFQPDMCVAARYNSSGIQFTSKPCTEELPVACYNFGSFTIARNITTGTSGWSKKPFNEAGRRCYEMGREDLNRDKFAKMFENTTQSKVLSDAISEGFPATSTRHNYINNAFQGSFLFPQTASQKSGFVTTLIKLSFPMDTDFWVGAYVDKGGAVISEPPIMQSRNVPDEKFAYIQAAPNDNRIYNYRSGLWDSFSPVTSGSRAFALFHHVRYKGLVPLSKQKKDLRYLCRKSTSLDLFIAEANNQDANFKDGASVCKSAGGLFLPPLTSTQWVKALQLVNDFDKKYSYPDPNPDSDITKRLNGAWVALETNTTLREAQVAALRQGGLNFFDNSAGGESKFLDSSGRYVKSSDCSSSNNCPSHYLCKPKNGPSDTLTDWRVKTSTCDNNSEVLISSKDFSGLVNEIKLIVAFSAAGLGQGDVVEIAP